MNEEEMKERLRHIAFFDSLTSLPNRTLLNDRLSWSLAHARRNNNEVAVLSMDIDRFKTINNTLGMLWETGS